MNLFKKKAQKNWTPRSRNTRRINKLEKSLSDLHEKVDQIGNSVQAIDIKTTTTIRLIPSLIIAILIVYPLQTLILETSKDHKASAWLSGFILDAKSFTAEQGLKWGINVVGGSTDYAPPLAKRLIVTSNFSKRRKHPVTGLVRPHNGTDYACKVGDPVYSMQSGVVKFAARRGAAGNMIVISHATREKSIYMHLDKISVRKNEKVATGEKIGTCGKTGRVTGPHLHIAILSAREKYINPVTVVGITRSADMWDYFKDTVAQSESAGSGGYKAVSPSGTFVGRYQMDRATINYAGFRHISMKKFKNTPSIQDEVYRAWQAKNLALFRNGSHICESTTGKIKKAFNPGQCRKQHGEWSFIPGFINASTPAYLVAGALHAAQFGPKHALRWYSQGLEFRDGNKVRISKYAYLGENAFKAKYGRFASAKPLLNAIEKGY
ncbi:MAG: hypothetical protein CSB47_10355 [Proteobacteria bacterium]|nr:MAG: hypothetical protein CSB47_10355 [Pseudomonadota bacterium]